MLLLGGLGLVFELVDSTVAWLAIGAGLFGLIGSAMLLLVTTRLQQHPRGRRVRDKQSWSRVLVLAAITVGGVFLGVDLIYVVITAGIFIAIFTGADLWSAFHEQEKAE